MLIKELNVLFYLPNVLMAYRKAMNNNCSHRLVDDIRKHTESRRDGLVIPWLPCFGVYVNRIVGAVLPVDVRRMNCILNLFKDIYNIMEGSEHVILTSVLSRTSVKDDHRTSGIMNKYTYRLK